jgi:hypothetical protein
MNKIMEYEYTYVSDELINEYGVYYTIVNNGIGFKTGTELIDWVKSYPVD